jgi:hypothetical protein
VDAPLPSPAVGALRGILLNRRRFLAAAGSSIPLALAARSRTLAFAQSPSPSAVSFGFESWSDVLLTHQRKAFEYFIRESNPANGLIPDSVRLLQRPRTTHAPASIAAVGFGLVAYVVGVERGYISREEAASRTLATLGFFAASPHGPEHDATGYKGFYYHFLDMDTGRPLRPRIRLRRSALHPPVLAHVDRLPRRPGRVHARSRPRLLREQPPRHAHPAAVRHRQPAPVRRLRPTLLGPHRQRRPRLDDQEGRRHRPYVPRLPRTRRPFGPDDGTVAPWAVLASLPFAPDTGQATLENIQRNYPEIRDKYCFTCSFNPTFTAEDPSIPSWTSEFHLGINLRPIVMTIENHITGLPWGLTRQCPYVVSGVRRAGFKNGWL